MSLKLTIPTLVTVIINIYKVFIKKPAQIFIRVNFPYTNEGPI